MQIAGLQKTTLVDYPGIVAATIFTRGCNFRCAFCHNPGLVLPERFDPLMEVEEIFRFLESRRGKIDGVCITGGEPTLHADLPEFVARLKTMGFNVKLDTNGSNPERLRVLTDRHLLDYIAMDIKGPLDRYREMSNSLGGEAIVATLSERIQESIHLILASGIESEFRTTVVKPLLSVDDMHAIARMIAGAKRYAIQNYRSSEEVRAASLQPFTEDELEQMKIIMKEKVVEVIIR